MSTYVNQLNDVVLFCRRLTRFLTSFSKRTTSLTSSSNRTKSFLIELADDFQLGTLNKDRQVSDRKLFLVSLKKYLKIPYIKITKNVRLLTAKGIVSGSPTFRLFKDRHVQKPKLIVATSGPFSFNEEFSVCLDPGRDLIIRSKPVFSLFVITSNRKHACRSSLLKAALAIACVC